MTFLGRGGISKMLPSQLYPSEYETSCRLIYASIKRRASFQHSNSASSALFYSDGLVPDCWQCFGKRICLSDISYSCDCVDRLLNLSSVVGEEVDNPKNLTSSVYSQTLHTYIFPFFYRVVSSHVTEHRMSLCQRAADLCNGSRRCSLTRERATAVIR